MSDAGEYTYTNSDASDEVGQCESFAYAGALAHTHTHTHTDTEGNSHEGRNTQDEHTHTQSCVDAYTHAEAGDTMSLGEALQAFKMRLQFIDDSQESVCRNRRLMMLAAEGAQTGAQTHTQIHTQTPTQGTHTNVDTCETHTQTYTHNSKYQQKFIDLWAHYALRVGIQTNQILGLLFLANDVVWRLRNRQDFCYKYDFLLQISNLLTTLYVNHPEALYDVFKLIRIWKTQVIFDSHATELLCIAVSGRDVYHRMIEHILQQKHTGYPMLCKELGLEDTNSNTVAPVETHTRDHTHTHTHKEVDELDELILADKEQTDTQAVPKKAVVPDIPVHTHTHTHKHNVAETHKRKPQDEFSISLSRMLLKIDKLHTHILHKQEKMSKCVKQLKDKSDTHTHTNTHESAGSVAHYKTLMTSLMHKEIAHRATLSEMQASVFQLLAHKYVQLLDTLGKLQQLNTTSL